MASLPSMAKERGSPFDAWQLLRFGDSCLSWMLAHGEASPGAHLRFEYMPFRKEVAVSVVEGGDLLGRVSGALGG